LNRTIEITFKVVLKIPLERQAHLTITTFSNVNQSYNTGYTDKSWANLKFAFTVHQFKLGGLHVYSFTRLRPR